jgi:hypothetical protein
MHLRSSASLCAVALLTWGGCIRFTEPLSPDGGSSESGNPAGASTSEDSTEGGAGPSAPSRGTGEDGGMPTAQGASENAGSADLTIEGPAEVDLLTYRLDYRVPASTGRSYRWTLSGPDDCINTDGKGCVLTCSGCEITSTSSTGYSEYPSSHFYVAAPRGGSFMLHVDELEDREVKRSADLKVRVLGERLAGIARPAGVVESGAFWRVDPKGRVPYPPNQTHSPMPRSVVAQLRRIAGHAPAHARDNSFIKVGDSITASGAFLGGSSDPVNIRSCWQDGPIIHDGSYQVRLPNDADLAPTVRHFRTGVTTAPNFDGKEETVTPLGRLSMAAKVGAGAQWALGDATDSPLEREIAAMQPLFAWIAYGSNDVGQGGSPSSDFFDKIATFQKSYFELVDRVVSKGIIPVLRTVPPRLDEDGTYQFVVPAMNALIRAKAESMQTPLVDFYSALVSSPYLPAPSQPGDHRDNDWGIGSDGLHPTQSLYTQFCDADAAGLHTGYAVEALGALRSLHRAVSAVVVGANSLDDAAPSAEPNVIDGRMKTKVFGGDVLTWGDVRSSADEQVRVGSYSACTAPHGGLRGADAASGPAVDYRLELSAATALRAIVADGRLNAHGIYVLNADGTCRHSGANMLAATLPRGSYTVRVHATDAARTGEYAALVVECDPADARCR